MTFEYGDYRFDLILDEPVNSRFLEATVRGGFGYVFKSTVCINDDVECGNCESKYNCVYQYVFETIPPQNAEKMMKYNHIPHPFVLYLLKNKKKRNFLWLKALRQIHKIPSLFHSFISAPGESGTGEGEKQVRHR